MPHTPEHIVQTPAEIRQSGLVERTRELNPNFQGTIGLDTITPETLAPTPDVDITQAVESPIPDISGTPIANQPASIIQQQPTDIEKLLTGAEDIVAGRETQERRAEEQLQAATETERRQINELNRQLKENLAEEIREVGLARERGETLGFASREVAKVRRNRAVKALLLSAQLEAAQGNFAFATEQVQRSINAEFDEEEKQIQTARTNIINNFDKFSAKEKKRAEATLRRLDADDQFLKDRKAGRNAAQKAVIDAQRAGFRNNEAIQEASKWDTEACAVGVLSAAGAFQAPEAALKTQIVEIGGRQVLINTQTGETIRDLGAVAITPKEREQQEAEIEAEKQGRSTALRNISAVNEILDDPNLGKVVGPLRAPFGFRLLRNRISQLKALLSLENRQTLKGQGTISDFEARILQEASSALGEEPQKLKEVDFDKEMKKIRGVFSHAAGIPVTIKITDPATGDVQIVVTDREGVEAALADGLRVEYK